MSGTNYWRIQSGNKECWPSWDRHDIISVGWDVGDVQKIQNRTENTSKTKQEIKDRLDDTFGDRESWSKSERDSATGIIRSVAGIREDPNRNLTDGDEVVVLGKQIRGESILHGIAKIGDYVYDKYEVEEDDHPYQREATYRAKGPVRIQDLPREFHDLQFRGTLSEYKEANQEKVDRLVQAVKSIVSEKGPVEQRQKYFNSDAIAESDLQKYIRDRFSQVDQRIIDIEREHSFEDRSRVDHICTLKHGDILGIETKLETATPGAVAQLVGYLENLDTETGPDSAVYGLLIAEDFRDDTIQKAREEGIELARFRLGVNFERVL